MHVSMNHPRALARAIPRQDWIMTQNNPLVAYANFFKIADQSDLLASDLESAAPILVKLFETRVMISRHQDNLLWRNRLKKSFEALFGVHSEDGVSQKPQDSILRHFVYPVTDFRIVMVDKLESSWTDNEGPVMAQM